MKEEMNEIFDTDLLASSMKKARRKSRRRIISTSIIVFIIGNILNTGISMKLANKEDEHRQIEIQTTIPNGYISKTQDTIAFLGGRSEYTLTKVINNRPVNIEEKSNGFGMLNNFMYISRTQSMKSTYAEEWPEYYWENGYRKMLFFHPDLEYKAYKNDLEILDELSEMQIVEMGLSFDKGYSNWEVGTFLKEFNVTWAWIDNYSEEQLSTWQVEIEEYDPKSCYIQEGNTFGISVRGNIINNFEQEYIMKLNGLKEHSKASYKALQERGLDKPEDARIIGVTVQGTPEELKKLSQVKEIKGATIGCVINKF